MRQRRILPNLSPGIFLVLAALLVSGCVYLLADRSSMTRAPEYSEGATFDTELEARYQEVESMSIPDTPDVPDITLATRTIGDETLLEGRVNPSQEERLVADFFARTLGDRSTLKVVGDAGKYTSVRQQRTSILPYAKTDDGFVMDTDIYLGSTRVLQHCVQRWFALQDRSAQEKFADRSDHYSCRVTSHPPGGMLFLLIGATAGSPAFEEMVAYDMAKDVMHGTGFWVSQYTYSPFSPDGTKRVWVSHTDAPRLVVIDYLGTTGSLISRSFTVPLAANETVVAGEDGPGESRTIMWINDDTVEIGIFDADVIEYPLGSTLLDYCPLGGNRDACADFFGVQLWYDVLPSGVSDDEYMATRLSRIIRLNVENEEWETILEIPRNKALTDALEKLR